ncbi:MAG: ZIP family metal transporter [Pseudomonadota bacterium]
MELGETKLFYIGVSLHRAHIVRPRAIGLIAFFAMMTPLGIALGALLGALLSGKSAQWFEGIFDALAAGTFLYIAVVDIVESEFAKPGDSGAKFAMVALGIAVMAVVAIWT